MASKAQELQAQLDAAIARIEEIKAAARVPGKGPQIPLRRALVLEDASFGEQRKAYFQCNPSHTHVSRTSVSLWLCDQIELGELAARAS